MPQNNNGSGGLKAYDTFEELLVENGPEQIVRWVNELAKRKEVQKATHKRYNQTQKELVKVARTLLSRDEIETIEAQVAKKELE